jgi:electron transfer flavoprotein alpha subunit
MFISIAGKANPMDRYKNIMVYAEITDGSLSSITKELLGCGKILANDLGEELCAVLIGNNLGHLAKEAIAFGANKVYLVDHPLLQDYQTDSYLLSMVKVVEQEMPRILILGQTSIGLDLSPRLAFRLNTAVVLDCVELSIDPDSKQLLQTKPVYGGKGMAVFSSESYPQMATVRSKSMKPLEREESRQGKIFNVNVNLDQTNIRTRSLGRVTEKAEGIKLEDAEIIISGGRGIGSADGFKQLEELSKALKGSAVGGTRPACDAGWISTTAQIGLTGKIVTPKLYITVALSGSSQHMAGCSGSGTIVAINNDPRANIFKEAQFGVVGDWKMIFPAFVKKVKELLKE